ncbi:hypothetical protein BGP_0780 [Beggiatoa sp. PS]|nr:hypothetical protein BGP_0780 [Beggiatoa sp. PS]
MGINIQTQPFTVIGIGDMSGDVFRNGLLLSEQIKLDVATLRRRTTHGYLKKY